MATQDIVNNNQGISYTNLDFSSVYTEILDTVKSLTYKWDPSISDESDPGVVLVKLSALIADKCNYNIDKSILEAFPLSVTQEANARQLYEQLGYYMNWYESATVPVTLAYDAINNPVSGDTISYTIPKFAIITDTESLHNYAIIGTEGPTGLIVSDTILPVNGNEVKVIAMEGTPVQYQFLGESVITPQMVDNNNRIYFTTRYISQNGIFIKNSGQENFASWKRVDNLYEQTYNELRYKFGFDNSANACYLEFPENYSELFGSGIEITYMTINPDYADIPAQSLNQFLVSISPKEDTTVSLNAPIVKINNYASASGHKDTESINEAYVGYKKVVGTFKTLITLRDYLNYIRRKEINICSNAFVCDRTNDVQSSYKIVGRDKGIDTLNIEVERIDSDPKVVPTQDLIPQQSKNYYEFVDGALTLVTGEWTSGVTYYELIDSEEALTPFSLKFYLLQNAVSLNGKSAYEETFNMIDGGVDFDALLEDTAHLEHTFEDILYFKDGPYTLTIDQTFEPNKGYYALTHASENPESETYYRLLTAAEIDNMSGTPASNNLYEMDIEEALPHTVFFRNKYPLSMNISTYSVLDEDTQNDIMQNVIKALYDNLNASNIEFGEQISIDYLTAIVKKADARIKNVVFDSLKYTLEAVYKDKFIAYNSRDELKVTDGFVSAVINGDGVSLETTDYTIRSEIQKLAIEKDIITKSILAGTTQLLIPDNRFKFHMSQRYINFVEDVQSITTEAIIDTGTMSQTSYSTSAENAFLRKTYTLGENETVTFLRPSLSNSKEFNSGFHYEYVLFTAIEPGQSHELRDGEYVILYAAQTSDETGDLTGYDVYGFKKGAIIKPTFAMKAQPTLSNLSEFANTKLVPDLQITSDDWIQESISSSTWVTNIRNNNTIIANVISGTDNLKSQFLNTVTLEQSDGYKFYWLLNNPIYTDNKTKSYKMFDSYAATQNTENGNINSYTLKSGEYLYYVDSTYSNLAVLGAGTTIFRNCGTDAKYVDAEETDKNFAVKFVDYTTLTDTEDNFEWIMNNGVINPKANGFYESASFDNPTTDETPQGGKTYRVALAADISGYYKNNTDGTFTLQTDAPSVYSQVDISTITEDVNPATRGYFERVEVNGLPLEDKYKPYLPNESAEKSDVRRTFNRFVKSNATTITTRNIFKGTGYEDIAIGDSSTYRSITISSSNADKFNPAAQGWVTLDENNKFIKDYTISPFTEIANITPTTVVTVADFYKLCENDTTFTNYGASTTAPVRVTESAYAQYRNLCNQGKVADNVSSIHEYIDTQWAAKGYKITLVRSLPSTWLVADMTPSARTLANAQAGDLVNISYQLLVANAGLKNVSAIYPDITNSGYLYLDAITAKAVVAAADLPLTTPVVTKASTYTIVNTDTAISNICDVFATSAYTGKLQIFAVPIVYEFKDLYAIDNKKYYTLNTYSKKTFDGTIQAWSCDAIDSDTVARDPLSNIQNWRTIQDNTSLTITENELWALSEGDILTVTAPTNDASSVKWPIFSNKEITLDVDAYEVAYKRSGETEYTDLEKLTIPGIDWKGYSSLILDTASNNGQQLQSNHYITLYDKNTLQIGDTIQGDSSKQIMIQLHYPVSNTSGSFIDVSTQNAYGEEILNSVYIFESMPSTERYTFSTTDFSTYINFNKNAGEIYAYLPANLPQGKYILPVLDGAEDTKLARIENEERFAVDDSTNVIINGKPIASNTETVTGIKIKFTDYNTLDLYPGYISKNYSYYLLDKNGNEYIPIVMPSILTAQADASPADLGWYEIDENGAYVLSSNSGKGTALVQEITTPDANANPAELYWMELSSSKYILSEDTTVQNETTYYKDSFFYAKRTDVDSKLKFVLEAAHTEELVLEVEDVFKFEENTLFGAYLEEIKKNVFKFDVHHLYNFCYIPKAKDLIPDPLEPKAFWNANHIMNKFTIAELDFDNLEYRFIT